MTMLEQVLREIHNWFRVRDSMDGIYRGSFAIENGCIALPFLRDGQYFRILGSVYNNGLHQYGPAMEALRDERFDGAVWALAVPDGVVRLAGEIAAWQEKYGAAADSPYLSESFGGYSYTKSGGADAGGWQGVFRARLNPYRKLREL